MSQGNCDETEHLKQENEESASKKAPQQRGCYVTAYQKHRLLQFVEAHYKTLFESSSIPDNALKDKLWQLLTVQLNCKGPNKDESGWRRCFICYKSAARMKLKSIQAA